MQFFSKAYVESEIDSALIVSYVFLSLFIQRLNGMRLAIDGQEVALRDRKDFLRTQKEITAEAERRLVETMNGIARQKLELTESETRHQNFLSEVS